MSGAASGWVAIQDLPTVYHDAWLTGAPPGEPGWLVHGAASTSWIEAASLVFTVPFGLFAVGFPASLLWRLATDPTMRDRIWGYVDKGQWFAAGLGVVLPFGLAIVGLTVLATSWSTLDLQWHQLQNRRGVAQGRHHYGLLLGPERLVWRSPESPKRVLSIAREDVTAVRTFQRRQTHQEAMGHRTVDLLEITWRQGGAEVHAHIPHVDVVGVNATEAVQRWWGGAP